MTSKRLIEESSKWYGIGSQFVYVYTFKSYREKKNQKHGRIKMKIGMTTQASPQKRINQQLGTSNSEKAVLLYVYRTDNANLFESLVHTSLKKKGRHLSKKESIGTEWFWVKENEIAKILHAINKQLPTVSMYRKYKNNNFLFVSPKYIFAVTAFVAYLAFNGPQLILPFFGVLFVYRILDKIGII